MAKSREQFKWILRNIRAQYKIPENIQDEKTMVEWMKRMRATKYMIDMMREALRESRKDGKESV